MSVGMDKSEAEKFEQRLNNLLYYITEYGMSRSILLNLQRDSGRQKFFEYVHEGFGIAQNELITSLLEVADEEAQCKNDIKNANRNRNKELSSILSQRLSVIEYKEQVFRKLADTIAWQLIKHKLYVARRYFLQEKPNPIRSSNLSAGCKFVEDYNSCNPQKFALLSDLTTFVQIGDVIIGDPHTGRVELVELKEGKVNKELREILDDLYNGKDLESYLSSMVYNKEEDTTTLKLVGGDKTKSKQLDRMMRQDLRSHRTNELLQKEIGKDANNNDVIISDDTTIITSFTQLLEEKIKTTDKLWSIGCIEGCLYYGIYKNGFPPIAFREWMKAKGIEYPCINYLSSYWAPLATPVFLQGFDKDIMMDIALGRTQIMLCLDLESYLTMAEDVGFNVRWLSRKETNLLREKGGTHSLVVFDDQAIELNREGRSLILGEGILSRIFYDLTLPSETIQLNWEALDPRNYSSKMEKAKMFF